jgi:hypothetical protein
MLLATRPEQRLTSDWLDVVDRECPNGKWTGGPVDFYQGLACCEFTACIACRWTLVVWSRAVMLYSKVDVLDCLSLLPSHPTDCRRLTDGSATLAKPKTTSAKKLFTHSPDWLNISCNSGVSSFLSTNSSGCHCWLLSLFTFEWRNNVVRVVVIVKLTIGSKCMTALAIYELR